MNEWISFIVYYIIYIIYFLLKYIFYINILYIKYVICYNIYYIIYYYKFIYLILAKELVGNKPVSETLNRDESSGTQSLSSEMPLWDARSLWLDSGGTFFAGALSKSFCVLWLSSLGIKCSSASHLTLTLPREGFVWFPHYNVHGFPTVATGKLLGGTFRLCKYLIPHQHLLLRFSIYWWILPGLLFTCCWVMIF